MTCKDSACPDLNRTPSIKYLDVTINQHLKFDAHMNLLKAQTRNLIYVFNNYRYIADFKLIKNYAILRPLSIHLDLFSFGFGRRSKTVCFDTRTGLKICSKGNIFSQLPLYIILQENSKRIGRFLRNTNCSYRR